GAMKKKWYIVLTMSGYEEKVKENIEKKVEATGIKNLVGRIVIPIRGGQRRKSEKLFPGYVFVEMIMNDEAYNFVRSVPYVMGFVSSGGQPVPVKDREMRPILRLAGLEEYEEKKKPVKVELGFKVGDMVKIISGPFEDFAGVIKEIDPERQELKVNVTIFGRETPVVLHVSEVEKIE
uniref:Transcription antitermination protein nusG n=1 Tax=Thermotoga maritima TaxID=2336 RepID=UPI0002AB7F9F|nr:Chain A, Transcription antitermination protein nusG [Thermotoga maritima]